VSSGERKRIEAKPVACDTRQGLCGRGCGTTRVVLPDGKGAVERYYLSSDCFISFAWSLEGKFVSFLSTFFANCFFSLLVLGT
jgi:hypothetical protein